MDKPVEMTTSDVLLLAKLADLPLESGREQLILSQLSTWISEANKLSKKMSEEQYLSIIPTTIFTHPGTQGGTE